MSFVPIIKNVVQNFPEPLGFVISHIPYSLRPGFGKGYKNHRHDMIYYDKLNQLDKKHFIFQRVYKIVDYAIHNVEFYKQFYKTYGFSLTHLKSFEDIKNIPIVTKKDLVSVGIEKRSALQKGRYIQNTGGSSGQTLEFYITPNLISQEWAHMHKIWEKVGYRQRYLKLGFGGMNLKEKPICYDGLRHQYSVNIYKSFQEVSALLSKILSRLDIKYIHGYPSAIYEFACFCENDSELLRSLSAKLKGCFLASEYPNPIFRNKIESVFSIPTVSWYGHTERAILAWEKEQPFVYHPFQTYGYCEAVVDSDGKNKLIGTSYLNMSSPFIRYDTGDMVEPVDNEKGLLKSFRIEAGREGDFITDKRGKKIPLTGFIFGRHHKIFEIAQYVQIMQKVSGKASVFVTPRKELSGDITWQKWFDSEGVDIVLDFKIIEKPVRSPSGKVVLKIQQG